MKKHRLPPVLCLLISLALPLPSAFAQLFGNSLINSQIYDINTATGAATGPRPTGTSLAGIAFQPSTGNLYGLSLGFQPNGNSLVQINPTTGATTVVGAIGLLSNIVEGDLAFNPVNGNLYGVDSSGVFFQMNVATGAATTIGQIPSGGQGDFSALAFNAAGVLFAIDTGAVGNSILSTINPLTGGILSSVVMNVNLGGSAGLTFDYATGTAYLADGVTGGTNLLYTLNTTTGVATGIGSLGITDMAGLAFRGPTQQTVPDAGNSAFLLGLGLAALGALFAASGFRRSPQLIPVAHK